MVPSVSPEPDESKSQSRSVHGEEKASVGGGLGGGPPVAGSRTNDHIVAALEAALVVASMLPYGTGGSACPESARALQIRPPSAPQDALRDVTELDGVQAVVVLDLSA